jgi:membrane protein implicated in regulation of membrane protease activity
LRARRLASAVFEFLVGDDWRTATGVVALLAATALLAAADLPAWPLTLVATVAVLLESVRRAYARHRGARRV